MPRNGSGSMSIPNSFSSGTTISSSAVNANFTDIATEITGSLPRDGQAAMTGQLKASSGSAASPGMAFSADTDTGFFRKGSNSIGVSVGGVEVAEFASGTLTITGTISFTGFAAGTVSAPSITFADDTDLGLYRIGANNLGVAANGAKVLDISAAGLGVTGTLTSTDAVTVASGGLTVTAGGLTVTAGTISLPSAAYASQSDQETATSTTAFVTPGRQRHHPTHPKAWGYATISGSVTTLQASHGVTSVSNPSSGGVTVTLSTPMSSSNYAVIANPTGAAARMVRVLSQTTTTFVVQFNDPGGIGAAAEGLMFIVLGDQ